MALYEFTLRVSGLDLHDDATLDRLFEAFDGSVVPSAIDDSVHLTIESEADGAEAALERAVRACDSVGAVVQDLDPDLVAIPDIAHRVGRSRESVRLFVEGKRGPGGFPAPDGIVGDGIRVWSWSDVFDWLALNTNDVAECALPVAAGTRLRFQFELSEQLARQPGHVHSDGHIRFWRAPSHKSKATPKPRLVVLSGILQAA